MENYMSEIKLWINTIDRILHWAMRKFEVNFRDVYLIETLKELFYAEHKKQKLLTPIGSTQACCFHFVKSSHV